MQDTTITKNYLEKAYNLFVFPPVEAKHYLDHNELLLALEVLVEEEKHHTLHEHGLFWECIAKAAIRMLEMREDNDMEKASRE